MNIYQDSSDTLYVIILKTVIIHVEVYGARRKDTIVFLYTKNHYRIENYKSHVTKGNLVDTKMSKIFDAIFDAEKLTFSVGG